MPGAQGPGNAYLPGFLGGLPLNGAASRRQAKKVIGIGSKATGDAGPEAAGGAKGESEG